LLTTWVCSAKASEDDATTSGEPAELLQDLRALSLNKLA